MVGMWGSFVPQNAVAFLGPLETAVGYLAISAGFQGASSLELLNKFSIEEVGSCAPVPSIMCNPGGGILSAFGYDDTYLDQLLPACKHTYFQKQCCASSTERLSDTPFGKDFREDLYCSFDSDHQVKMQEVLDCMDYVHTRISHETQWDLNILCYNLNLSILDGIDYGTLDAKLTKFRIVTLTIIGRFKFPTIEPNTELTKYLEKAQFRIPNSSEDPFELPEGFTNLSKLKILYIKGPVIKLPDMSGMDTLEEVEVDLSCTGFDKFSQDFLEFVYYMGDKLKENLKIYLNCTPLKELPVPTEGDNTRLKKLKWSLVLQMYGSGFGDNSDDWVKSVFIGDNKNCESHCCPKDGCKSQDDLITEFNNNRPANVSLDKW